jgi:3,4-dihydroxy 2-butanone 4-phosphate synthase/GTP cyclohydrolase II
VLQDQTDHTAPAPALTPADGFCTVPEALAELRAGRMLVVADDEHAGSTGGLTIAAEHATAEAVNLMATHGRGLVSLALTPERCVALGLPPMAREASPHGPEFTVSIEAREGVSTGISAADRARTIRVAVDPEAGPTDLVRPGHMFPVRTRPGGVLERRARAEAAVDLARLAGLRPAGVTCEVLDDDGALATVPALRALCAAHGLKMVSVAALAEHRSTLEHRVHSVVDHLVRRLTGTATADLPPVALDPALTGRVLADLGLQAAC